MIVRNVWSHPAIALSRPDVRYHLLAIDFLPASVLRASLRLLSAALAAGELQPLPDVTHSVGSSAAALRQLSKVTHLICMSVPRAYSCNMRTVPSRVSRASYTGGPALRLFNFTSVLDLACPHAWWIAVSPLSFQNPHGNTSPALSTDSGVATQANHVGKVTVRMAAASATGDSTHPAPGAVLITGGLGALGSLLATWLAKRSATLRLVLVGRTGHLPKGAGSGPLQELISGRAGGGMVTLRMGDIASAPDAAAACRTGSGKQPPLQVWHGVSLSQIVSQALPCTSGDTVSSVCRAHDS